MYYIEKADKLALSTQMLSIIKTQDNKIIVPMGKKVLSENKVIKLAKRTHKKLVKTNSRKIVLSKELQENEIYKNMLYTYGYDIVDGKWLFEAVSYKVLDYIVKQKNIKKEETQISVLVNNLTDYTLENIKILSKEYKSLNIVTNHIDKFKKVEDQIYEESGLMITVTNNKKKSLLKSAIILNIDFPKELINEYNIFDEAIIVNIYGNVRILKKRFNGLIINDYEIMIDSQAIQNYIGDTELYFSKHLYEAEFYQNMPFRDFQNKIKEDKLEVCALFGLNEKL